LENGDCGWEIITCPQITFTGYLREIEASWCMDNCSNYSIETESGNYLSNVTDLDDMGSLSYFKDRFVDLTGDEVWCVECGAVDVAEIYISVDCPQTQLDCFQDPCEVAEECQLNTPVECVANYCGGCYADFYDLNGNLVDCYAGSSCSGESPAGCFQNGCPDGYECIDDWENSCVSSYCDCDEAAGQWVCTDDCNGGTCIMEECVDLTGLFFGLCDMLLGVGYAGGSCQNISGCGWVVDGVDYSGAFFESMDECEEACGGGDMTCEEIESLYDMLHTGENATCEFDNDCMAVWGDCSVGLGGCHYAVSVDNYPDEEIDALVDLWLEGDCMSWVCDCSAEPYAQCIDGTCTSAYCMSDNPAGCFQTGCEEGSECIVDESECVPSWCGCDGFYGDWFCTEDCGGGSCVESGLLGDLNGDGVINVMDIVLVVDAILHAEYDPMGDINSDGQLNVVDIVQLINLILG